MNHELNRQLRENERRRKALVLDAAETWRRLIAAAGFDAKFERLCDIDTVELQAQVDAMKRCKLAAGDLRAEYERLKAEV